MALYRQISPVVDAEQVRVADGTFPIEVTRYELPPPSGAFGFVGTGAGLVEVFDGDWVLRDPSSTDQPASICRPEVFSRKYQRVMESGPCA